MIIEIALDLYMWFNEQMLDLWNNQVEGFVPLINLATEG